MAMQLDERIHALTRQRNEQEAILFSMIEGVVPSIPKSGSSA